MKILVTVRMLENIPGGVENFTYCITEQLVKMGHHVEVFCLSALGELAIRINQNLNVNVYNDMPKKSKYDLILSSNHCAIKFLKSIDVQGPTIQTFHGTFLSTDDPYPGLEAYVSVSEGVQSHLLKQDIASTVILNGINCDTFKPHSRINKRIKKVLSLCQSHEANEMIQHACNIMDLDFFWNHRGYNPVHDIYNQINKADLVISLGRGAYESMACGRAVVVLDKREYFFDTKPFGDGMILPDNIDTYIKRNCSGYYYGIEYSVETLLEEFDKYDQSLGDFGREYALKNLNMEKQIQKYLALPYK